MAERQQTTRGGNCSTRTSAERQMHEEIEHSLTKRHNGATDDTTGRQTRKTGGFLPVTNGQERLEHDKAEVQQQLVDVHRDGAP